MLETYDIQDAQPRLRELVLQVNKGIEVTQAQKPAMPLGPIQDDTSERIAGLHLGMGWMSDDFDDPLPDEFWEGE